MGDVSTYLKQRIMRDAIKVLLMIDGLAELNFLACRSTEGGYYDLFLQTGSDVPSGKTCSNYQTIHLPCLC